MNQTQSKNNSSSALTNIIVDIVIPVALLTQIPKRWDDERAPVVALVVALSFPIIHFIIDFVKTRKSNFISVIGAVSVFLTGIIGVMQIPNEWLAVKEAAVPCIIMLVLLVSMWLGRPLVGELIYSDALFDKEKIHSILEAKGKSDVLPDIMKKSTLIVAFSFLISTILNYVLASTIVVSDPITQAAQRTEEIGRLTGISYLVIALPCTLIMLVAVYYLFRRLGKETGLTMEEMMNEEIREKTQEKSKE